MTLVKYCLLIELSLVTYINIIIFFIFCEFFAYQNCIGNECAIKTVLIKFAISLKSVKYIATVPMSSGTTFISTFTLHYISSWAISLRRRPELGKRQCCDPMTRLNAKNSVGYKIAACPLYFYQVRHERLRYLNTLSGIW